ncbi:transglutaminase domain-containing protein [Kribbella deserti]|uniref:Transglutaminase domain-containing protein n=1 Tax=Kribbella deserti TaxID=1926257 RepID=A0ABV6QSN4_9ACTN
MTSRLLSTRRRRRLPAVLAEVTGETAATPTLDWHHAAVGSLHSEVRALAPIGEREFLKSAHRTIAEMVRPVYALEELQAVSTTLAKRRGSCSQRMAVLEALARAEGIPTRVRGLAIDGRFWYPRFPAMQRLVPETVLLAWPEFRADGEWLDVSALFGPIGSMSSRSGFTNTGPETLFDAIGRTAVDWDGVTCGINGQSPCDLSGQVVHDYGRFSSRDALFAAHGQSLCWTARRIANPLLTRSSAHCPTNHPPRRLLAQTSSHRQRPRRATCRPCPLRHPAHRPAAALAACSRASPAAASRCPATHRRQSRATTAAIGCAGLLALTGLTGGVRGVGIVVLRGGWGRGR